MARRRLPFLPFLPLLPVIALTAPSYGGCNPFGNGGDGDPCDADPAGCGAGEDFELDPSCTLEGELEVQVGHGENDYVALSPNEEPQIHFGAQGGTHVWLGIRVVNHARDYPKLEVHLELLYTQEACEPECSWSVGDERTLVLGPSSLELTDDGGAQAAGITMFPDGWSETPHAIRATVRDPCGREGTVLHAIGGG